MRFFKGRSAGTAATGAISGGVEPQQRRVVRTADPTPVAGEAGVDGQPVGWIDTSLIEDGHPESPAPCPPRQVPGFRMTPSRGIQPAVAPKRVIPSKSDEGGCDARDGTAPSGPRRTPRPSKPEIDRYVADLLADEESGFDEKLSRVGDGARKDGARKDGDLKDQDLCRPEPQLEAGKTEMDPPGMTEEFHGPTLSDREEAPISRVLGRSSGRPSPAGANSDRVIDRSRQTHPAPGAGHVRENPVRESVAQRRIWELDESEGGLGDEECDDLPVAARVTATSPLVRTANALRRVVSRPLRDGISDPGLMPDTEDAPLGDESHASRLRDEADASRIRSSQTVPMRPHPAAPGSDRADLPSDARTEGIRAQGSGMTEASADRSERGLRPVRAAGRVKTRLLGFQHEEVSSKDLFSDSGQPGAPTGPVMFPVGWLVITAGEGRGASFALFNGVSQLGRGEDQAVQLDFGDTTISRQNHAAIAFDDELGSFFLGHGGKSNLVRLNGKPVLSTEPLNDGDAIRLGQTTLRFVALCGEKFSWIGERGGAHGHAATE